MGRKHTKRGIRLGALFSIILICVFVVAMGIYVVFINYQRTLQTEDRLYAQAAAFADEMDAVWQFFDVNQDNINYNSDGTYDFKGLYCSIVGKGIGAIFTENGDYTIRYTGINVRNKYDSPDGFEAVALEAITGPNASSDEYYDIVEYEGQSSFRYVRAIYLSENCLECHGGPKGELDVTGYPKEGLEQGDFAGAISIVIPTEPYLQDEWQTLMVSVVFIGGMLALIAITVFFAIDRLVTRPVSKLSSVAAELGDGNFNSQLEGIEAKGELGDLVQSFSNMASQLNEVYNTLEDKVALRTEEVRRANEVLERQRVQLAQSNELLKHANMQLTRDNKYKDDFLAVMSHELRTPLTAILTFVEVLEREIGDSRRGRNAVQELKGNTIALLNMINDTLEMAATQAGRGRLVVDDVDLMDVTNYVDSTMAVLAEKKGVRLESSVAQDVPIIRGDWERIRHAMENLVSNAIKFTSEGGHVNVDVTYKRDANEVAIAVRDTGIGIAEEDIDRIFDKFTQVDGSTTRGYSGSGLGLSVVKDIAQRHGGSVSVESELGRGSVFTVVLPVGQGGCTLGDDDDILEGENGRRGEAHNGENDSDCG